ncbi:MAG: hypothetical protein WCR19_02390 [Acholeplasmataceae bacterium]
MNKKIVIFIAILISLVSIVFIAVWGTLPENNSQSIIESITISDYDETNEDGDKFKDILNIVTSDQNIYIIEYEFLPTDAVYRITATSSRDDVSLQVDEFNKKVYVYFDLSAIGKTVTIRIIDKGTQEYDEITLWFKSSGVIIVPDL